MEWLSLAKLPVTDTLKLKEPWEGMSLEDAENEIAKINCSIRHLVKTIAPYKGWIKRTHKRIEALVKGRHTLQTYITIGVKKIPQGVEGTSIPKDLSKEDVMAYIGTLDPAALEAVAKAFGMGVKEEEI